MNLPCQIAKKIPYAFAYPIQKKFLSPRATKRQSMTNDEFDIMQRIVTTATTQPNVSLKQNAKVFILTIIISNDDVHFGRGFFLLIKRSNPQHITADVVKCDTMKFKKKIQKLI